MKYVMFKENPNTHKEVYLYVDTVHDEVSLETVAELDLASEFASASAAYAFGGKFPATLGNWRVGLR